VGKNQFLDKGGNIVEGKFMVVGFDSEGREVVKIVKRMPSKRKPWRVHYACGCEGGGVYGKKGLHLICKDCGLALVEIS
jgi:uncharacterized membrane protein